MEIRRFRRPAFPSMIFMGEVHIESYRITGSHVGLTGTDLASMIETCGRCFTFSARKKSTLRVDGIAAMDGTDHCYTQRS